MKRLLKKKIDISIIVPCLNEQKHIKNTLFKLLKSFNNTNFLFEILVIDDGSTDKTLNEIKRFSLKNLTRDLKIFSHKKSMGIGFIFHKYSKKAKGEYVRMVMGDDVDLLKTHKLVLRYIKQYDIIIPVYKSVANKSKTRMFVSKVFTLIINIISFTKINYYNGSVTFRSNKLKEISYINDGFGFQAEIITKMIKKKSTYIEINTTALHRNTSNSISMKNFLRVAQIIFRIIKC